VARYSAIFSVLLGLLALPVLVQAANNSPAALVTEMVVKIKALRSSAPVVEYVDWDIAFERAPEAERNARGFRSSAEMRDYYFRLLSDPERFARQEVASRAALVPPEKRAELEQALQNSLEDIRAANDKMREQLRQIQFDVGEEKITGDTASVMVSTTLNGETSSGPVELIRKNGRWYLPSIVFATAD